MRVLVVVDAQNEYVTGPMSAWSTRAIIPHICERIKNYADGNTLILFTKDTHEENFEDTFEGYYTSAPHCIRDTHEWSLIKDISSLADGYSNFLLYADEEVVRSRVLKNTFGSIKLCEILKKYESEITEIVFMGFNTDVSVISNALMARTYLPETHITVDASCCVGTTLDKHLAALEVMKSCLINVIH